MNAVKVGMYACNLLCLFDIFLPASLPLYPFSFSLSVYFTPQSHTICLIAYIFYSPLLISPLSLSLSLSLSLCLSLSLSLSL